MRYTGHKIFLNGKLTDISNDLDFYMSGRNIYEVIRIIDGKILYWQDHLNRLENSLQTEQITFQLSDYDFPEMIAILIHQNMIRNMNIRIDVFITDSLHVLVGFIPSFYPDVETYNTGVKTVTLRSVRHDPAVKAVHHELRIKVDRLLKDKTVFEVLLVNEKGLLTEGSRTNLFFIKGSAVLTAKVEDVLPGVTRNKVIKLCRSQNITVKECNIRLDDIQQYDACFLTGTSPKVMPVSSVDNFTFKVQNSVLLKIMDAYNLLMDRSLYKVE
ncbi:aminotransferase class IV [Saccharicrinis sp. FJH54]|uniref:aminotransferase class IV n=1 Tax=Saccharicrinis sp. FJH54 TaxID=3344665 RepID=UPI0035D46D39